MSGFQIIRLLSLVYRLLKKNNTAFGISQLAERLVYRDR